MQFIRIIVIGSFLSGCSFWNHHQDVRPGASGTHTIILNTDDRTSGYREAKFQADNFCGKQHKTTYILSEEYHYTGTMSESDYLALKAAAKVARNVGQTVWALSKDEEGEDTGMATAAGGAIADDAIGSGYKYTVKFQCQ
ncbi:hypothetical protein [Endozoicomonas euniceicola]|uniref:Lipoprotein n=1 Tax=Endozoicomonas euniceicola TaxID=1234143 RepID=A0ABY6GSP6_9GAMM|nr:hypothetical protein [Endozoicomonas euniceicola]UYM15414.1 hypothetical protein NX720_21595 [Endozoicomonas euniceicola]